MFNFIHFEINEVDDNEISIIYNIIGAWVAYFSLKNI